MRFHLLAVLALCASAAACDGCASPAIDSDDPLPVPRDDDAGPGPACVVDDDCPFGDECVDGACQPVEAIGGDQGCMSDADCPAGSTCAPSTGRCVEDAEVPPAPPGPPGPCTLGDTRTCGEKIGACDYGVESCVDDGAGSGTWSGVCQGGRGPSTESCNSIDDDCDSVVDNGFVLGDPCSAGLGVCAQTGVTVCAVDGAAVTCSVTGFDPTGRQELCGNGLDDDCDGVADDAVEFPALGATCSVGAGQCARSGVNVCTGDGVGIVCDATPGQAGVELCGNGLDDDCDGTPDDGFESLGAACTVGATCAVSGAFICSTDLLALTCQPAAPVGPEPLCNGVDDDGDLCVDDGFVLGEACAAGVGVCRNTGVTVCNGAQNGTACSASPGAGSAEVCGNAIDEDCNGFLDNGFNLGAPCTVGVGACSASGTLVCGPGGTSAVCSATAGTPAQERCGNAIDEDCSGALDNGFDIGAACSSGVGICARIGVKICNSANTLTTVCSAVAGSADPLGERCGNGLDDDCDTQTDEGFTDVGAACTAGVGECTANGVRVCNATLTGTTCNATAGAPSAERCDDRDNDCNTVIDNGCDDDGDDYCDASLAFGPAIGPNVDVCALSAAASLDCNDANGAIHPGAVETCFSDSTDMNCDGDANDGCTACNASIDNDFDGSNQCVDCDDTNGAARPGATELCDGIDNDCDDAIDETFDVDGDTFTTCGTALGGGLDPSRTDCNDAANTVYPGACELCATASGTVACGAFNDRGNGVDESCNGFVDETCSPCSTADTDGDGVTGCQGDCNNNDPTVAPGRTELCDGKDNDCNLNTVQNCDIGDECGTQAAGPYPSTTDACQDDQLCLTPVNASGNPSGDPTCTSTCNNSFLNGGVGDGCQSGQTCTVNIIPTANVEGCQPTTATLGTGRGGDTCNDDADCRAGICLNVVGPGAIDYCHDHCSNDSYCGPSAVCQASSSDRGDCRRPLSTQTRDTGTTCSGAASACLHGARTCIDMNAVLRCSEPCCTNTDCPSGYYCSMNGPSSSTSVGGRQTVPMCFQESGTNGGRQAGAACTANVQCASEMCDRNLGVCIDTCCNDGTCPTGLTCELVEYHRTDGDTFGRFCVNTTPAQPLEKL